MVALNLCASTLPESVARDILYFEDKLNAAVPRPDGSVRPLFLYNTRILKAIAFLLRGSLAPITGTQEEINTALSELVGLYELSLTMSIPKLENAVIDHIDGSSAFTIKRFIDRAAPYLDSKENARATSLGRFFESYLKENLQAAAEMEDASYKLKLKT